MKDLYDREINYLRLSITDKCNLRCIYCMPESGTKILKHQDVLSHEEIVNISKTAVSLGITKIRITGGEPLIKKDILQILFDIRKIDGLKELCLTTNGTMLKKYAKDLYNIGVDRINISIDSLKDDKYKYITRDGDIKNAKDGINEVLKYNFKKIKFNTVLIGGFNDDEVEDFVKYTFDYDVDVRFIELMPMKNIGFFDEKYYISAFDVLKHFKNYEEVDNGRGVAKLYKIKGAKGCVGIITPLSNHFCADCSRLRVTFDGKIKPCLHSREEINIKNLSIDELRQKMIDAINKKPKEHEKLNAINRSLSDRNMNMIGG